MTADSSSGPSGLLLIDKPSGITSHDAVDRVRRALGTRKVGHAGTLDPMATGLLLMGVGRGTRLLRFLGDFAKTYEGTAMLGVETSTLDADGEVVRRSTVDVPRSRLVEAMSELTGEIQQVPPAYSAVKVSGRPLYVAARRGERVDAAPREATVFRFDLVWFEPPMFDFVVRCSGGTYVRTLVADAGTAVGSGAHLTRLRRTSIGPFEVKDARQPEDPGKPLPLEAAVAHLPAFTLHPEEARVAAHGRCLGPTGIEGPYRALAPDGRLIGIYRDEGARSDPLVILSPA